MPAVLTRHASRGDPPQLADLDLESWFGLLGPPGDDHNLYQAWHAIKATLGAFFPDARLYRTATLTGASCAESTLPPRHYLPSPDAARAVIRAAAPQHRQQAVALPQTRAATLHLYDRRLAYLRHLRHLPVNLNGEISHFEGRALYDPDRPGWYRATIAVPPGWAHIGLVHAANDDETTWRWPNQPGDTFTGWYHWREVQLLDEYAWPYTLHEAWLFDPRSTRGSDPLRLFADKFTAILDRVELLPPSQYRDLLRHAYRACVLRFIGLLHRLPVGRVETFPSYAALPPEGPGDRSELLPDGAWRLLHPADPDSYAARWYRPEWAAAVWAASRVATTKRALSLPRAALAAIDADALYLLGPDPGWPDAGGVGDWRHVETWTRPACRGVPCEMAALRAVSKGLETW